MVAKLTIAHRAARNQASLDQAHEGAGAAACIKFYTAEGGTHGANVSVANSGDASGDPFDAIVINNAAANGGGTAFVYDTTSALQGTMGIRLTPAASRRLARPCTWMLKAS